MRISDWSSDVCSSDLDPIDEDVDGLPAGAPVVGGQRADAAAVEGNPWAQPGDQEKDDVTDAGRAQRPGRTDVKDEEVALGQDAGESARHGAHGRAACRESVCHYGLISVGAEALHKQPNTYLQPT